MNKITQALATFLMTSVFCLNASAQSPIANAHNAMDSGNFAKAYELFVPLGEAGNTDAQHMLGFMLEGGQGVDKSPADAAYWYERAALGGNATSMYMLGLLYEGSDLGPSEINEALRWYKMAAEAGSPYAAKKLTKLSPTSNLADLYQRGVAEDKAGNYEHAAIAYKKAGHAGDAKAQREIGLYYYNGTGVPQSTVEAVQWMKMSAKQGDIMAQFNLGVIYSEGKGIAKHYKEAAIWFEKAAHQGHAKAQHTIGTYYESGRNRGVAESFETAVKWYRKSADQAYAKGQWRLALMYEKGWGIQKSQRKEIYWMQQAAKQGHSGAKFSVNYKKKHGYDMTNSYVTPNDTSLAGYHADGVKAVNASNKSQAINSFRIAAEKGHAPSQAELGAAYMQGYGLEENFRQSRKWVEKSAAQGDPDGYFLLGNIYYNGLGVTKDERKAYNWYNKASQLNHSQAIQAIASLDQSRLQANEILAAKRRRANSSWKDGQRAITQRINGENACKERSAYLYKYGGTYNPNEGYYVGTGANAKFVQCD